MAPLQHAGAKDGGDAPARPCSTSRPSTPGSSRPQYEKETEYLRAYLAAIRRKLEPEPSQPRYFITETGMGYRFEDVSST